MELKRDEIIQGLRDNDSPYKSDQDSIRDAIAFINELTEECAKLTEEKENLHASCTELTRKLECANLEIECKERILESYMLQYGTVADKEVFLKKERADTIQNLRDHLTTFFANDEILEYNEVDADYINGRINEIVEELLEGK